ncbi:MAG TPA: hypothetical protein VN495_01630 [Candidatus Paceibacterota bacterium]|nr:hypothetical protein [Candidatus Paceibacterota bacterium]
MSSTLEHSTSGWDARLEKFGWFEKLMDRMVAYGIDLAIEKDPRGEDVLVMQIEQAQMTKPSMLGEFPVRSLQVEFDEASAATKIVVPWRCIVCGIYEAFRSIAIETDERTGERTLKERPKNTHSGYFFFQVLNIDRPNDKVEFAFRSDFNDEDLERRRARRAGGAAAP